MGQASFIDQEQWRRDTDRLRAEQHRWEEIVRRDVELYGPSGAEVEEAGMKAIESPPSPSVRSIPDILTLRS